MGLTGDWDEADELAQQTFIKAFKGLHNFRGESAFSSWLFRIMTNLNIDNSRRNKPLPFSAIGDGQMHEPTDIKDVESTHQLADVSLASEQINASIQGALNRLSLQQRSIFIMRHYHDLPLKTIGGILGVTTGTVKSQLFRALQGLRKHLAPVRSELGMGEVS
jgi:RNA polymerase sigma-70 factor (ECF subfamily)